MEREKFSTSCKAKATRTVTFFFLKVFAMIFVFMWFRWTFPRLRVDQLMYLEWKVLLPIGFVNLFAAAVVVLYNLYPFPIIVP